MSSLFHHHPNKPCAQTCEKAYIILCNAHDTSTSLLESFNETRRVRGARGTPTDEEQDLLRAMLTFASAGLDSMVKQLVNDALPDVIEREEGAATMFEKYVERRIKQGETINYALLAKILVDHKPKGRLIMELVSELAGNSLQSVDQLLKVGAFFNIPSNEISTDKKGLQAIFHARNEIVHEMDVDFSQHNRNRRPRRKLHMIGFTNDIFRVSNSFLESVEQKLTT